MSISAMIHVPVDQKLEIDLAYEGRIRIGFDAGFEHMTVWLTTPQAQQVLDALQILLIPFEGGMHPAPGF